MWKFALISLVALPLANCASTQEPPRLALSADEAKRIQAAEAACERIYPRMKYNSNAEQLLGIADPNPRFQDCVATSIGLNMPPRPSVNETYVNVR